VEPGNAGLFAPAAGYAGAVLVPDLRPLSVGEIIDVAIKIWRRHLPTLARIVVVVVAPVQILAALVMASVSSTGDVFNGVDAAGNPSVDTHAMGSWVAGMLTAQTLSALAFLISSAAVLRAVSVAYLGGTPQWRESLRAATRRLRSLIWLGFLLAGGLGLAMVALVIPFFWLGVSWSIAFPVLIAEGERGAGALGRAFRLVRGRWWPTAGALTLAFMFQAFVGFVAAIPIGILGATGNGGSLAGLTVSTVINIATSVITTPFMAAVLVLIYFDLRVRKEGFDLELLAQAVGTPGAGLPASGQWTSPGSWAPSGGAWPAPSGPWPAPSGPGARPTPNGPTGSWAQPANPGGEWDRPIDPTGSRDRAPGRSGEWDRPIDPTGGWGPPPAPEGADPDGPGEPAG